VTPSDSGAFAARMVGVEEELMLVDPESGVLVPCGQEIVAGTVTASQCAPARGWGPVIKPEFFLEQVETATRPCTTLSDLDADVRAGRRLVRSAAETAGIAAVAMPTPVVEQPPGRVTPTSRYRGIRESYGGIARDSLICAMHIHVEVRDDHEGVAEGQIDVQAPRHTEVEDDDQDLHHQGPEERLQLRRTPYVAGGAARSGSGRRGATRFDRRGLAQACAHGPAE